MYHVTPKTEADLNLVLGILWGRRFSDEQGGSRPGQGARFYPRHDPQAFDVEITDTDLDEEDQAAAEDTTLIDEDVRAEAPVLAQASTVDRRRR
jgi:hypothetical protein